MSGLVVACAGGPRTGPVTPAEIPALKAQAAQQPRNAQIQFRLAAALMAVGRCDTAVVVAKAGQMLAPGERSEEHTSELQSQSNLVCRLLLEKKNIKQCERFPR